MTADVPTSREPSPPTLSSSDPASSTEKGELPGKDSPPLIKTLSAPGPPPNGGTTAWLQVLGSFCLLFNTWGLMNVFALYQSIYETGDLFVASSSTISWIGSIQAYMLLIVGLFAGPLYDAGYLKLLLLVGSFAVTFGHMMLSLSHSYWHVMLSQGVVIGFGSGCLFIPGVSILQQYFTTRLGLAIGIGVSGSAFGGIIYPIVLYRLIGQLGFPWAVRIVGFLALVTLIIPLIVAKLRIKPAKVRSVIDWTAFTDVPFLAFTAVLFFMFHGLFLLFFYYPFFATSENITDARLAAYLVPVFCAGSLFGRLIPNAIAGKAGAFNVLAVATSITGILMLCMMAVHTVGAIVALILLLGFWSGALVGIPPICYVELTKDKSRLGTRIGMAYALLGIGSLTGGPVGGALLGSGPDFNWTAAWTYAGLMLTLAGFGVYAIKGWLYSWSVNVRK